MKYLIWGLKLSGESSLELLLRLKNQEKNNNLGKKSVSDVSLSAQNNNADIVKQNSAKSAKILVKKVKKDNDYKQSLCVNLENNSDTYSRKDIKIGINSEKVAKNHDFYYLFDENKDLREKFRERGISSVVVLERLTKKTLLNMDEIIISPSISIHNPLIQFAKQNGVDVIGELELGFKNMNKSSKLIAITGTNGKTTTTELVYEILKKSGVKVEKVGNIGIPFTSKVQNGEENVTYVCETSSFQLESCKTFHPNIACIINVTPDHIDRHGNMTNYLNVKKSIFAHQNKDDFSIIPSDMESCFKSNCFTFDTKKSVKRGAYIKNRAIYAKIGLFSHRIWNLNECKLFGVQFEEDILCAVLIAKIMKVKNNVIREVLGQFLPSPHRLQLVYVSKTNNKYFDDSKATNVDATIKAVQSFDAPTILLCGGSDKKCDFDGLFLSLPHFIQKVYAFGETAGKLLESHKTVKSAVPIEKCATLRQAVFLASQEQNKIILLSPACASFDEFASYKERGDKFLEYIKDYYENFEESKNTF